MGGDFAIIVLLVAFSLVALLSTFHRVHEGELGVVKRRGRQHRECKPGLVAVIPFVDTLEIFDRRVTPVAGERYDIMTRDGVVSVFQATVYTSVESAKQVEATLADQDVAIDSLARSTFHSVLAQYTLEQALAQSGLIAELVRSEMDAVAFAWGIRVRRVEILDVVPPSRLLELYERAKERELSRRLDGFPPPPPREPSSDQENH